MAKNKKKGFFSWLGFGNKEQEPQQPEAEEQLADDGQAPAEPAVEEVAEHIAEPEAEPAAHSEEETQAFADEVVEVTQEVVQQESVALPKAAAEPAPTVEPEPVAEAEVIVAPEPVAGVIPAAPLQDADIVEETADEPALSDEELEALALAAADESDQAEDDVQETQQEQEKPTKEGFFARLKRSLLKTKENLGSGFISLFRGKKIDDDLFEELEEQLLIADVGVDTTRKIIANLTEGASRRQLRDAEALYGLLKEEMSEILAKVDEPLNIEGKMPFVILMVGVNGVGKTTTIGKLARQFEQQGKSVMLAAGDTFRAAAVEQLQVWGQRNNIPVIAQHTGADSASVIFDAIQAAKARHVDVLIADTAGRLQNKSHLMEELKKIVRVMKKLDEDAPHEVMLTIDASTGQNAISQAKLFHEAVGLTGITLTKLDGTAKGGVIFSVADQFGIPIRYIGVGERIEDLRPFKSDDFIEALFARED
ncbi:signal recognition particle-docking protein FtsY [Pluralibacter gergoviae]|uniref:signal recognition particle-docking protein FtsY n=1 Tax=Pluralibacter gergoviae TaxID=61647 RepID=UPI0004F8055F|nr:signal recognition particle-docking protein FtsY [Pluralibacter gergoviae]AIQ98699.1 signal recognition particle-docking protein FtsY [Pluralibacter gergoviae]EKT9642975.1 signal recognition particle-docking protein FtsY [Pluralibacter gergoviae]EKV3545775.1 signal recognition particle-docking protein FtsY [Pluralibacter gergoviae]EKV9900802.1 signal recognition particle-docking protein FtsY [Pluralibacter gergoviae]EKV9932537.1 signal recognition particle-docking protein FtsY [Pluralibacte